MNKQSRERQAYVPAEALVIEIKAQGIICTSPDFSDYENGGMI